MGGWVVGLTSLRTFSSKLNSVRAGSNSGAPKLYHFLLYWCIQECFRYTFLYLRVCFRFPVVLSCLYKVYFFPMEHGQCARKKRIYECARRFRAVRTLGVPAVLLSEVGLKSYSASTPGREELLAIRDGPLRRMVPRARGSLFSLIEVQGY